MYQPEQPKAAGVALINLVYALKDGAGLDDIDEGVALLSSLAAASDEIQANPEAAIADIVSGAGDRFARLKQNEVPE